MSPQNWLRLASLCFVLSLPLSAWSLWQGRYSEAMFQFFLGASVALLLRRRGEMKAALLRQATPQNTASDDVA
jgi:hypothetical protein